jgi:hypothetical protein
LLQPLLAIPFDDTALEEQEHHQDDHRAGRGVIFGPVRATDMT